MYVFIKSINHKNYDFIKLQISAFLEHEMKIQLLKTKSQKLWLYELNN